MAKKRAGRPPIEGEKRSRSLRVVVTPSDYELFRRLAKAHRSTVSDWIRDTLKKSAEPMEGEEGPLVLGGLDEDRNAGIMSTDGDSPKIPVQQKLKLGDVRAPRRTKRAAA